MSETTTKKDFKLDTTRFTEVIDDAMKPDTIVNIQKKFNLDFPFKVKRVRFSPIHIAPEAGDIGRIITVPGYKIRTRESDGTPFLTVIGTDVFDPIKLVTICICASSFKDYILWE